MRAQLLFGIETEYAGRFARPDAAAAPSLEPGPVAILGAVAHRVAYLQGRGAIDLYLANGARLYVDAGGHVELATAECADPSDLTCQVFAGDQILEEACRGLVTQGAWEELALMKGNIDYSGGQATWGSHENYLLLERAVTDIAPGLAGHLVSRIIYTGGGGFWNRWPSTAFTLSPRSWRLTSVMAASTQSSRGIINTREEPLGSGGRRLHLICGESLCSHRAMYLRVATTALVTALLDQGLSPGDTARFDRPLAALHVFTSDPTLRATAADAAGRPVTAHQMQRRYLQFVESHLKSSRLPRWARTTVALWRDTLDRLESQGALGLATTLDWAIKYALYNRWLARSGFTWESFHHTGRVLGDALRSWQQPGAEAGHSRSQDDFVRFAAETAPHGSCPQDVARRYLDLRLKLLETETRFGRLGDGTFAQLERRGLVDQRTPGVDPKRIRRASRLPPKDTRARARGMTIRHLHARGLSPACSCRWDRISDPSKHRFFDLADEFSTRGRWRRTAPSQSTRFRVFEQLFGREPPAPDLAGRVAEALRHFQHGDYELAHRTLGELPGGAHRGIELSLLVDYYRFRAWINARRGNTEDALAALSQLDSRVPHGFEWLLDHVCTYRFLGLRPHARMDAAVTEGMEMMRANSHGDASLAAPFLSHAGYHFLKKGDSESALQMLTRASDMEAIARPSQRPLGRMLADLAEAHRTLGRTEEAGRFLVRAREIQESHRYSGDLADFTLAGLAKLQADRDAATRLLTEASNIQLALRHEMGQARTLVLLARVQTDRGAISNIAARILDIRDRRSALRACPGMDKILLNWADWVGGAPDPQPGATPDAFWGV